MSWNWPAIEAIGVIATAAVAVLSWPALYLLETLRRVRADRRLKRDAAQAGLDGIKEMRRLDAWCEAVKVDPRVETMELDLTAVWTAVQHYTQRQPASIPLIQDLYRVDILMRHCHTDLVRAREAMLAGTAGPMNREFLHAKMVDERLYLLQPIEIRLNAVIADNR